MMNRKALITAGFVPTEYPSQEGEFLVKTTRVHQMPSRNVMLQMDIFENNHVVITEVCPDRKVQVYLPEIDVLVCRHPVDSDKGQVLIQEAMAANNRKGFYVDSNGEICNVEMAPDGCHYEFHEQKGYTEVWVVANRDGAVGEQAVLHPTLKSLRESGVNVSANQVKNRATT